MMNPAVHFEMPAVDRYPRTPDIHSVGTVPFTDMEGNCLSILQSQVSPEVSTRGPMQVDLLWRN